MKKLLVIPARGGSKRIKKKNIKFFKGQPIISWAIKEALNSKAFDKVIVSTDDQEIANIAFASGAEIPFMRPKNIADDFASTRDVIIHAIEWFKAQNVFYNNIFCLYPTTPFLKSSDILNALKIFESLRKESFVFAATSFSYPIQRALRVNEKGLTEMTNPQNFFKRSQDLEEFYHDAGQFYLASSETWLKKNNIFSDGKPYFIPRWKAIDIDTAEDWEMAEIMYEITKNISN